MNARTCVAVVTDETYLPGSLVLLSSFLEHNPWFDGRIVVIHDGLGADARARLSRLPHVELRPVHHALTARLQALASHPTAGRKLRHFYSLEAFGLRDVDWVLALDSDILCAGDAAPLIAMEGGLVCCPDQSHFWATPRDPLTYEPAPVVDGEPADVLPVAFNAGVMLIRPGRLSPSVYEDLLDQVRPDTLAHVTTGHTDSVLLNRYFRDAWTQAPDRFNYLISAGMWRYKRPRAPMSDSVFLHFLGRPKPWQTAPGDLDGIVDPGRRTAFSRWHAASRGALL